MIKQLTVVLLTNKYSNKCVVHANEPYYEIKYINSLKFRVGHGLKFH